MNFSVIVPTLERPNAIIKLLDSIAIQTVLPIEVIIIDASSNDLTEKSIFLKDLIFPIKYRRVEKPFKGSAQQRNYGLTFVSINTQVIHFLDDDLILERDYFQQIEKSFTEHPDAIGVGGIDLKDNPYRQIKEDEKLDSFNFYKLDGWVRKDPIRTKARKVFGLITDLQPDIIPNYSHGRSGFPPNGYTYQVEHLIGMSMSFRKSVFNYIHFSEYFEGYGLYEDFDFCVRALPYGKLYVNTNARVWHYHEPSGRPNKFKYGKMVVRNGWYVWKQRFPQNSIKARIKWQATDFLLAQIRLLNVITGPDRLGALTEYCGRTVGWFSLWFNRPGMG